MFGESEMRWDAIREPLADGTVLQARFSTRAAGDFHIDDPAGSLAERRLALVDRPWAWIRQVHGTTVIDLDDHTGGLVEVNGVEADAMITGSSDVAVSVTVADCAPVVLWGDNSVLGVAHAGWQGTLAGVIEATATALRRRGANRVDAVIGPCIAPSNYEFGVDDLDKVAARLGPSVRATTDAGSPALDLRAAVAAALDQSGVRLIGMVGGDTGAEADRYFSHRARREAERQVAVAWKHAP